MRRDVAAIGNGVDAFGMPLRAGFLLFAKHAVGWMQVERPSAKGNCIGLHALFDDVLLGKHVITHEPSALSFARNGTCPL